MKPNASLQIMDNTIISSLDISDTPHFNNYGCPKNISVRSSSVSLSISLILTISDNQKSVLPLNFDLNSPLGTPIFSAISATERPEFLIRLLSNTRFIVPPPHHHFKHHKYIIPSEDKFVNGEYYTKSIFFLCGVCQNNIHYEYFRRNITTNVNKILLWRRLSNDNR